MDNSRLTILETNVSHVEKSIVESKSDIRDIRNTLFGIALLGAGAIGGLYVHINNKTDDIGKEIKIVERDVNKLQLQNENILKDIGGMKTDINSIKTNLDKLAKDK